ncbi:MAG: HupE/UreJ family protein [Gemmatimonas sp.]
MSEFLSFLELGLRHILDPAGLDHVLFLAVLAVVYRARDWRNALWVVSAFTIGHSITLALSVTDAIKVNQGLIEFLIPVTIVLTAAENLFVRENASSTRGRRYRPLLAGAFGLVHGAGFAGYLKSLFLANIAMPLLGFNVGIEVAQILVLLTLGVTLAVLDAGLRWARGLRATPNPAFLLRLRVVGVSMAIGVVAIAWSVERRPW